MRRFENRRALVTGASRGIGAGIAKRLGAEGAHVALVARTVDHHDHLPGSLNETMRLINEAGGRAVPIVADLSDPVARRAVIGQAAEALGGPIEILVNNAAAAMYEPLDHYPLKRRLITFDVNVHVPLDLAQDALEGMVEAGEGWIVNLSSGSARMPVGPPFRTEGLALTFGIYGASKAALNRLTGAMAAAWYPHRIRVNTVEPNAAVLSEGADRRAGSLLNPNDIEPMETMVEAAVALCCCPVEHTGMIERSLDMIERDSLPVMHLDGVTPFER